jgi:hypothetical protein
MGREAKVGNRKQVFEECGDKGSSSYRLKQLVYVEQSLHISLQDVK